MESSNVTCHTGARLSKHLPRQRQKYTLPYCHAGKASDVPTKATLDSDCLSIEFTPLPSGSTSSGGVEELKLDGDVRIEVSIHSPWQTCLSACSLRLSMYSQVSKPMANLSISL